LEVAKRGRKSREKKERERWKKEREMKRTIKIK